MKSVDETKVFRQYLQLLPINTLACPLYNYDAKKLTDFSLVKLMIMAVLSKWESHRTIALNVGPEQSFQQELNLKSISHSQISRRLNELNTAHLADLLGRLARHYWILQRHAGGMNPHVGILRIIDATYVKLPDSASNWTAISKVSSGIKLHIRLVVASANSVFPEKMIPSTGNIADVDAVNHIIDADSALYIMDRGYGHKTKMGGWMERNIDFLVRVRHDFRTETLRAYTPELPNVLKDELVSMRTHKKKLRYIEFVDEKNTHYHLITTRLELSEKEILDAYKNRWYIELFFKWIKQHLKVSHLYSESPKGIWNQMFLTLITFALSEILRLTQLPNVSAWAFLRAIRAYIYKTLDDFLAYMTRPLRKSKGRQKIPISRPVQIDFGEDHAIVRPISKHHYIHKHQKS
ncbi:MAG: IS4 family transposase [Planococcus citreus]